MSNHITVNINDKDYIVATPRAYRILGGQLVVGYHYWSTRNGDYFGPQRIATTLSTGKGVGAQLVAAAREAFDVDHDQLIADYLAREAARA